MEHIDDLAGVKRRRAYALASIFVIVAIVAGCETSTTITEGPDAVKCQVSTNTPPMLDAGGGAGTLAITTQPECAWTASTTANWISGLSPTSGQGTGNLQFRVSANDGTSAREGNIVVNESTVRVSQRAPCRFDLGPASQNMHATGGNGSLTVSAMSACAWAATTDVDWISLTAPLSGNGDGTVRFTVEANRGSERTGHVLVAGQSATVTQSAPVSPCTYTITPTSQNIGAAGGGGSVRVGTQNGCRWTGSSNASWITLTSDAEGVGDGTVAFTVASNPGVSRTGTLMIAGRTFSVAQAAASAPPCTFSILPTSQNVTAIAGTGTVTVSAAGGCAWTATSNAPWITVTSGANGSGNGSVGFSVAVNAGPERIGTLTIGGQTFTVTQAAVVSLPPPCTYSMSPPSQNVIALGGTGTVSVTTAAGCTWTATSNLPWITITSGATGTGSGSVAFVVAINLSASRTGTLTIAGQIFTVTQEAVLP